MQSWPQRLGCPRVGMWVVGALGIASLAGGATAEDTSKGADFSGWTHAFGSRSRTGPGTSDPSGSWRPEGTWAPRGRPCGLLLLTQNFDNQLITPLATFECLWANANDPSEKCISAGNAMARSYDLSTGATAGADVIVRCVTFGVELNGDGNPNCSGRPASDYDVAINLYLDMDGGAPEMPSQDLSLIGSTEVTVPAGAEGELMTGFFDPGVAVPADSVLVVEIYLPDRHPLLGGDSGLFFLGSNSEGETGPSYIRGLIQGCMYPGFRTYEAAGHPETQVLQTIGLDLVTEACCFADGSCQDLPASLCSDLGEAPQGSGSGCSTAACPQPCVPVTVDAQPVSQIVCEGRTVTFAITAAGTPPFGYQWRKDGVGVPGATSATYEIGVVNAGDPGNYDVTVTNDCGLAISDSATLVAWPAGNGDVNGDGFVNGRDVGLFVEVAIAAPGSLPTLAFCASDLDGDGQITQTDLGLLLNLLLRN